MDSSRTRVLVTGASGTVGKPLVKRLLESNYQVMCLVRDVSQVAARLSNYSNAVVLSCDFQDEAVCAEMIDFDATTVIHLAANLTPGRSYNETLKLIDSNILFGTQLLNVLMKTNVQLFVNAGTFKEYYHGGEVLEAANLYGASKMAFRGFLEFFRSVHGFKVAHVVPGTIYGSNERQQKVLDLLIDSLGKNEVTRLAGGETELDLIHVNDLVEFFEVLLQRWEKNEDSIENNTSYYVGECVGRSLKSLVILLEQLSGLSANIHWDAKSQREKHLDKVPGMEQLADPCSLGGWNQAISIEQGLQMEINKRTP